MTRFSRVDHRPFPIPGEDNMVWLDEAIHHLTSKPICGYADGEAPSVEPTALAAMALMHAGCNKEAVASLDWLVGIQSSDGSLGIYAETQTPCWATGWAVQAWNLANRKLDKPKSEWSDAARTAVEWVMETHGTFVSKSEAATAKTALGHDVSLRGWPWAKGTHSWIEPTAISLMALKVAGFSEHPRYREAITMLLDRQLPRGGWNYGNTVVLGHVLLPHVQPTGLALAALADEKGIRPQVQKSLDYLSRLLSEKTTTSSLCYALIGLAGLGEWPEAGGKWLEAAYARTVANAKALVGHGSPYFSALSVLAAKLLEKRTSLTAHVDPQGKASHAENREK